MTGEPGGTVLIGGASGLIGSALVADLTSRNVPVRRLVRGPARTSEEVSWSPSEGKLPEAAFEGVTSVVALGGAGIADHRWSAKYRRELVLSRVNPVRLLATRMAQLESPARLITASAVGYYGDRGEEILTENSPAGAGFLARLCEVWERAADPARDAGIAVAHARTGIVLDPSAGALGTLLPLLRLGLAGPMGSGRQWWPWITLNDEVRAIVHLVSSAVVGPVNLCSPNPERNATLIAALAAALHRPARLPVPTFALRAAIGGFGSELVASQRVVPEVLLADGFEFTAPTIEDGARQLFG